MSMEMFKAIIKEEKEFDLQELNGLQHKFYDKFPVKIASQTSDELACNICLNYY